MVWNGQIEPEQAQDAAGERLGQAQGKVEDEVQRQHEFDRQVGVDRLPAWRASRRRRPARHGRLVQPQREIAASPQSCLVHRPVGDAVAGARDAMATSGIVLKRHAKESSRVVGITPPAPLRAPVSGTGAISFSVGRSCGPACRERPSVHLCLEHQLWTCALAGWPRRMPSRKSRHRAPIQVLAGVVAARATREDEDRD